MARPGEPAAAPATTGQAVTGTDVVVLLVADFAPGSLLWGWSRLVRGPRALRGTPGLRFARVLGSGHEGRFGLRPSGSVQGLFAVFRDADSAAAFADRHPLVAAYRRRARESCTLLLRACASRGRWGGQAIAVSADAPASGPVASLTRASIRPSRAVAFWRHAPPAQASLDHAEGCRFAVGLGEAPLLRQATFTLWESAAAMDAYARTGAHQEAIRAAYQGGFFSETMFVRFAPLRLQGSWKGRRFGDG
jgi:spheroidene monooxygenase